MEFKDPVAVAIRPHNIIRLYVADQCNDHIQVLNSDLTFYYTFGSNGNGNGQFNCSTDVAFDSFGNVYVADTGNHRIQVFTAEGKFLRTFGKKGESNGELHAPPRIEVSNDNNIVYMTEMGNCRVSMFTCEGEFVTSFGTKGIGPGQFNEPRGILVDENGVIFVSDCGNNRLQLF